MILGTLAVTSVFTIQYLLKNTDLEMDDKLHDLTVEADYAELKATGKINLSNIGIMLLRLKNLIQGDIYYEGKIIGNVSLFDPEKLKTIDKEPPKKLDFSSIKIWPDKTETLGIILRIKTGEIPLCWMTHLEQREKSQFNFTVGFSFTVSGITLKTPLKYFGANISTNLLGNLTKWERNLSINEEVSTIPIIKAIKKKDDMTLKINLVIWKINYTFLELNLGEILWGHLDYNKTEINHNIIIKTCPLIFNFIPIKYKIYINGIEMGEITFDYEYPSEKKQNLLFRKNECNCTFQISFINSMLDDWIVSHIQKQNTTNLVLRATKEIRNRKIEYQILNVTISKSILPLFEGLEAIS